MTAYLNGHTIHQHRHRGHCWYTIDDDPMRFESTGAAAAWVRARLSKRPRRPLPPVPTTQALRRQAMAA